MAQNADQIDVSKLVVELKTNFGKFTEEQAILGKTTEETKAALTKIQDQLDGLDLKINREKLLGNAFGDVETKSTGELITEHEDFAGEVKTNWLSLRKKDGRVVIPIDNAMAEYRRPRLSRKSLITTTAGLTVSATGVQQLTRLPGITGLAMQALRIRDLCTQRTTTTSSFDYVKQLTRTNAASPQTEGSAKAESTYAWNSASGTVQAIAHFVNVTKQALADVPYLQGLLNQELMYGLKLQEEAQILLGDGVGAHLNGIITQATAFTSAYTISGDTKLDVLRHAKLQSRLLGLGTYSPDGIVLNPTDMHWIELIKDETGGANKGRYIIGDPRGGPEITLLWGLPVIESDSIPAGTFLVGSFANCEVVDRMDAEIEISYEHASNFTANLATVRAEERVGLAVRVPGVNITGALPANV